MSIKLAICMPKYKSNKIKLVERILPLCEKHDIELTVLDASNEAILTSGPFHVLIHKVADYSFDYSTKEAEIIAERLRQFSANNPKMVVIDDFEVSRKITDNRTFMVEILQACTMKVNGISIFVPKVLEIGVDSDAEETKASVSKHEMKFPLLAKPMGSTSHNMVLMFSKANLVDAPKPCILQEFCNHSGILYKVFVVGDVFNLCQRPSIKDIAQSESGATICFDTRNVSKTGKAYIPVLHECDPNQRKWLSCDEEPNMLDREVVGALVKRMRELTGLYLFGLDILVDVKSGDYALVDCNQFPGYKGINDDNLPNQLVELITKLGKGILNLV